MHILHFLHRNKVLENNSSSNNILYRYLDEQPISVNSFIKFVCLSASLTIWSVLLFKCACLDFFFFCLYEPQLETAADRDSRGEATSVRLNAICEVRCVIDLSGPWSLFSISIYPPSQQHIPVSPFCPTRARQLFCSQTDIHTLIHPHPHTKRKTEWSWHSPSSKCKLPDVDIRTRGDHGNMQIYCSPISEVDLIILSPLLPGSYFSLCVTC